MAKVNFDQISSLSTDLARGLSANVNPISEFHAVINQAGLITDQVIPDGKVHRCGTSAKPKSSNGWYILFSNGLGGAYGDWGTGLKETWSSRGQKLDAETQKKISEEIERGKAEREEEKLRCYAEVAEVAVSTLASLSDADQSNPYLKRKGVQPCHNLKADEDDLIVPIFGEDGKSMSFQRIQPNGEKRFLTGGQIKGGYFPIIGDDTLPLHVCEGTATGLSIHESTGATVLCAFSAGNLIAVAKMARSKYPVRFIIICADDDSETMARTGRNTGLEEAKMAAQTIGGKVAVPVFASESGTDFNDLHNQAGPKAVTYCLQNAKEPVQANRQVDVQAWPEALASEALHGPAGDFVRLVEPHSEADRVALLSQFLIGIGNLLGRNVYFKVEADEHYLNMNMALVGETSKGRKGTSWGHARSILSDLDEYWGSRIMSGLSSGEGCIWQVRDPITKTEPIREKKIITGYQEIQIDPGVEDKRLLVLEPELASTLRVMGREGNTLSAIVRQAWDSGDLRTLTKNNPAMATNAHISIIGHITRDELRRYLDRTEIANGFANRFIWLCTRRSKVLPEGGRIQDVDFSKLMERLRQALRFGKEKRRLEKGEEARQIWADIYPELSEGKPGLLGAVIGRAEAQVMRLSCLYAVLDCSASILKDHLLAALALWEYAENSASYIFGNALGDPVADELLALIRNSPEGVTRTNIRDHFKRNKSKEQIERALEIIRQKNLVRIQIEQTGGRPVERWFSIQSTT